MVAFDIGIQMMKYLKCGTKKCISNVAFKCHNKLAFAIGCKQQTKVSEKRKFEQDAKDITAEYKRTIAAYKSLIRTMKSKFPNCYLMDDLEEKSKLLSDQLIQFKYGVKHDLKKFE